MTTPDPKAAARRRRAKRMRKGKHDAKVFLTGTLIGALALAMVLMSSGKFESPSSTPTPATVVNSKALTVQVEEDTPGWDCSRMGNRICGPNNSNRATPGIYDQDGQLIAKWGDWLKTLNKLDRAYKKAHAI